MFLKTLFVIKTPYKCTQLHISCICPLIIHSDPHYTLPVCFLLTFIHRLISDANSERFFTHGNACPEEYFMSIMNTVKGSS